MQRSIDLGRAGADRQGRDQVAIGWGEDDEFRAEGVQRGGGGEDFLHQRAERRLVGDREHALGGDRAGDGAGDVVDGDGAARDGDALGGGGGGWFGSEARRVPSWKILGRVGIGPSSERRSAVEVSG